MKEIILKSKENLLQQVSDPVQILHRHCFSIQAIQELNQITCQFLKTNGLSVFEFARVFDDHTAIILYTSPEVGKYIVNKQIHVTAHIPNALLASQFWYIPSKEGPYSQLLRDVNEMALGGGFADYIEKSPGYFDMYCFWSPRDQGEASNQFINMKENLQNFCFDFRERAQPLILASLKDRFTLPEPMRPNFGGLRSKKEIKILEINDQFKLLCNNFSLFGMRSEIFTQRDLECIRFLLLGKTAQDMAGQLNLSLRTVEHRIDGLKQKLQCAKKSQIVETFLKLSSTR
jgi:DNA-binding CsgD family transcriptional regulator